LEKKERTEDFYTKERQRKREKQKRGGVRREKKFIRYVSLLAGFPSCIHTFIHCITEKSIKYF